MSGSSHLSPLGIAAGIALICACAGGTTPSEGVTPPVGSPGFCPGDDRSGVPLQGSPTPSEIPVADARRELDARNSICGDTWCEGSFEWYVYDLRSAKGSSEMTMRTYSTPQVKPVADVKGLEVKGTGFTGRVLDQHEVPSCTTPCQGFATPPEWAPGLVLDLRCVLGATYGEGTMDGESRMVECGIRLEAAIRERIPEFAPP